MNRTEINEALAFNHELGERAFETFDWPALQAVRMQRQQLQDSLMRLSILIGSERRALKAWGLNGRNRNKAQSQNEKAFLRSLRTPEGKADRKKYFIPSRGLGKTRLAGMLKDRAWRNRIAEGVQQSPALSEQVFGRCQRTPSDLPDVRVFEYDPASPRGSYTPDIAPALHIQMFGRVERVIEDAIHEGAMKLPPQYLGYASVEARDRQWAKDGAHALGERFDLSPELQGEIEAYGLRMAGITK